MRTLCAFVTVLALAPAALQAADGVTFRYRPLQAGEVYKVITGGFFDFALSVAADGQVLGSQQVSTRVAEVYRVEVVEAGAEGPTRVRVRYFQSESHVSSAPGSEQKEVEFASAVAARMPAGTINLAGQLTLAQSACVIAGARVYVGPDTVTTHMAAAAGVPTVALYGPSNPVKWGPWPKSFAGGASPWRRVGSQSMGNVTLVQGVGACVPCMREGCDQHVASFSECLRQLPLSTVTAAVERALRARG